MRILTYNIKRAQMSSISTIIEVIDELEPDVLFVQEIDRYVLRSGMVDQHRLIEKRGNFSHSYFIKTKNKKPLGSYGHSIFLKDLEHTQPLRIDLSSATAREPRIAASFHLVSKEGTSILLAGAHLAPKASESSSQLARLLNVLKVKYPLEERLILAGDFNMKPESLLRLGLESDGTEPSCGLPERKHRYDYVIGKGFTVKSEVLSYPQLSDHDPVLGILDI